MISGVISSLIWVITIVTLLITPLITTHEPPGMPVSPEQAGPSFANYVVRASAQTSKKIQRVGIEFLPNTCYCVLYYGLL